MGSVGGMALKAAFLEFSGIIIQDGKLQQRLTDELLIAENLRPDPAEFAQLCRGRSDRAGLRELLQRRGRVVSSDALDKLVATKSERYRQALADTDRLPLYPGLQDLIYRFRTAQIPLYIVTGAPRADVDWVLSHADLADGLTPLITAENLARDGKDAPGDAYRQAIAALNAQKTGLNLTARQCLAIAATYAGIESAKAAEIPVAGVAHLYPYRMVQRRANWVVDYLNELEVDWLQDFYAPRETPPRVSPSSESQSLEG